MTIINNNLTKKKTFKKETSALRLKLMKLYSCSQHEKSFKFIFGDQEDIYIRQNLARMKLS